MHDRTGPVRFPFDRTRRRQAPHPLLADLAPAQDQGLSVGLAAVALLAGGIALGSGWFGALPRPTLPEGTTLARADPAPLTPSGTARR